MRELADFSDLAAIFYLPQVDFPIVIKDLTHELAACGLFKDFQTYMSSIFIYLI